MFSSAPRCHRSRWRHRSRQVVMISVVTRHSGGEVIRAPKVFSDKVSSLSSVSARVS